MSESKKKHLYLVAVAGTPDPSHYCVRAHTRQQAITAIASRNITARRAEADDIFKFNVAETQIIDATVDAAQEPLPLAEPEGTAAEQLEAPAEVVADGE